MPNTERDPYAYLYNPYIASPPPKRSQWKTFMIIVWILIIIGGACVIYALDRYTQSDTPTILLTATPTPIYTAQDVITAIMKQPDNDAQGNGVSYGTSLANWMNNAYKDIVPSSSSATWYISCCHGGMGARGIWVYSSQSNVQQEYTILQQENASYIANPQTWPMADVGWTIWTHIGRCIAGDISATDALALPRVCE